MTTHTDERSIIGRGRAVPRRGIFVSECHESPRAELSGARRRLCSDGKRRMRGVRGSRVRILAPHVCPETGKAVRWNVHWRGRLALLRYYMVSSIYGANHKSHGGTIARR